ncbi:PREDICTED: acyl-CoA-binding protein isoform X2 [Habropoda laboriosa]|nr:PREDICTED: acyl-CoA-binding protein isoform X2 [Habropoda laboriosa]
MNDLHKFNKATEDVKNLSVRPTDFDLLELYGLYKQALVGDCNTLKPGMLDFKGKAKWNSWNRWKGTSQDDAKEQYISKVEKLISMDAKN